MPLGAPRPQGTEAAVVVRTRRQPRLRIDVQVQTLVAVAAVAVAHEEVALGHAPQVVLVQELAALALLAQAAEPVLADEAAEGRCGGGGGGGLLVRGRVAGGVPVGTACFERAVAGLVGFADGAVGGEGVLVGALEEGREGEGVVGCGVGEHLLGEVRGCLAWRRCCGHRFRVWRREFAGRRFGFAVLHARVIGSSSEISIAIVWEVVARGS